MPEESIVEKAEKGLFKWMSNKIKSISDEALWGILVVAGTWLVSQFRGSKVDSEQLEKLLSSIKAGKYADAATAASHAIQVSRLGWGPSDETAMGDILAVVRKRLTKEGDAALAGRFERFINGLDITTKKFLRRVLGLFKSTDDRATFLYTIAKIRSKRQMLEFLGAQGVYVKPGDRLVTVISREVTRISREIKRSSERHCAEIEANGTARERRTTQVAGHLEEVYQQEQAGKSWLRRRLLP